MTTSAYSLPVCKGMVPSQRLHLTRTCILAAAQQWTLHSCVLQQKQQQQLLLLTSKAMSTMKLMQSQQMEIVVLPACLLMVERWEPLQLL